MSKVYAIHEGCRFEGGGVSEIYADKEKAIKFALMLLEQKKEHTKKIFKEKAKEWEWEEQPANGMVIKCWQNRVDEIIVYEYDLK